MKNIIFIFSFLISINIYANTEDALCMNFARVLLGLEPGKHIVYVSINSYKSSKDVPPSKYNYRKAPNIEKFNSEGFPLLRSSVLTSFCGSNDSIIFIEKEPPNLSNNTLALLRDTKWLIIIESQYKDGKILGRRDILTEKQLNSLKEFKFINKETLFSIPTPQYTNGVCLQWNERLFNFPTNLIKEDISLIEDIAIMASALCSKKIDISNINIPNSLDDIKSKIHTRLGAEIYAEMRNIIEEYLIKAEFKKHKNSTLDFELIENKLNKNN